MHTDLDVLYYSFSAIFTWQLFIIIHLKVPGTSQLRPACEENDFLCMDGTQCVSKTYLCDGEPDCLDYSDELICAPGPKYCEHPEEFQCHNGECIPRDWVRDKGLPDCTDGSDEIDARAYCKGDSERFLCTNREQCVPGSYLCDSVQQCWDGSDEDGCDVACLNNNCSHTCRPTPAGPVCLCPPGFHLINHTVCLDEDECSEKEPRACEHKCVNTAGSFHCECQDGYQLWTDQRSCVKPRNQTGVETKSVKLMVAGTQGIYDVSIQYLDEPAMETSHMTGTSQLLLPRDVDSLAYDLIRNQLIFHDVMETTIKSLTLDGIQRGTDVPTRDLYSDVIQLEDMALDPIAQNIYWTTYLGFLFVGKLDGSESVQLIKKRFDKPRGIALDLERSFLYLTIWGQSSQILKCHLDGTSCINILYVPGHPNYIVTGPVYQSRDTKGSRPVYQSQDTNSSEPVQGSGDIERSIYWTDSKQELISSLSLDTRVVTQIQLNNHRNPHPFGLAVTCDVIFYTDLNTHKLHGILMSDTSMIYDIDLDLGSLYDVLVLDKDYKLQSSNACAVNNGGCSDFCFPRPGGLYVCRCPLNKHMGTDNKTCQEMSTITTKPVEEILSDNEAVWQSGYVLTGDNQGTRDNKGNKLWILGVALGALAFVVIVLLGVVYYVRKTRRQAMQLPKVLRYHKDEKSEEFKGLVHNEDLPNIDSRIELEYVECMTGQRPREISMISADSAFTEARTDINSNSSLGSLLAA